ncbi:MATE family efflux transporter [Sphingomonas sp. PL-96]|uniref:MATE family efflux transporter n=1 Tax=Sphingomonas sp. PL-96 TaxID=2887201 RepID=UPI001E58D0F8|nr:MATE family efflux transporter [Sphingomonas sp. PL-96]MCC2975417.1 MATE family efflux transporter [Sphingomonas sp. PL-96]
MSGQGQTAAKGKRRGRDLTQGPITRTLLVFSLPVLGGNALQSLNGSINQFWVSHSLGITAITAIGNANIVMMLMLGAIFGVSMAANILVGQSVGAGDLRQVKKVMGTSITFFAILALGVAAVGYRLSPHILALMGTPAEALAEAETYLRIVFLAMPFLYFFAFLQMAQRGIGDSRTPFLFMLLAVVLDILLNPMLIRGIGPFPRLGIAGSAFSTLIGQGTSLVLLVALLYRRGSPLMLRPGEFHLLKPDPAILKALVLRGLPMGLQILVMSGAAMVMIGFVNSYGAVTAAAYTAASQVWTYIQMPAMAVGAAVSSMAAQNVGAQKWDRVGKIARSGVLSGLVITGLVAAIIYPLGDLTLHIFLPPDSPALPVAGHINTIVLWSFVLFSVTFALSGVVRSTGAVWPPLLILIVAMFLIRIPFAELLIPRLGADAIWWSFPLGTITSSILTALYYRYGNWRKTRLIAPERPQGNSADAGMATPAVVGCDRSPGAEVRVGG